MLNSCDKLVRANVPEELWHWLLIHTVSKNLTLMFMRRSMVVITTSSTEKNTIGATGNTAGGSSGGCVGRWMRGVE